MLVASEKKRRNEKAQAEKNRMVAKNASYIATSLGHLFIIARYAQVQGRDGEGKGGK